MTTYPPVPCPSCGTDVGLDGASCFITSCSNYGVSVRRVPPLSPEALAPFVTAYDDA